MKKHLLGTTLIVPLFVGMLGLFWPGQSHATEGILTDNASLSITGQTPGIKNNAVTKGTNTILRVSAGSRTASPGLQEIARNAFLKFDLAPLPRGTTGTNIVKATLVLYVNTLKSAGTFQVVAVRGTWDEHTLSSRRVPETIEVEVASVVPVVNDFVTVDLTGLVRDWVTDRKLLLGAESRLRRGVNNDISALLIDGMIAGGRATKLLRPPAS